MDGTDQTEPAATMKRVLWRAYDTGWIVYACGRFYDERDGAHDIHMNQGSTGETYRNNGGDPPPHWDGNDVWQDGALIVDRGQQAFAAYFARFTQQVTPTDARGNPAGCDAVWSLSKCLDLVFGTRSGSHYAPSPWSCNLQKVAKTPSFVSI